MLLLVLAPWQARGETTPVPVAQAADLRRSEGYLLLNLDAGGISPSLTIRYLGSYDKWRQSGKLSVSKQGVEIEVSLKGLEPGLYVLPMSQGVYQVTAVAAPYFDLPFRLDVAESPNWRFSVEAGQTNYLGKLYIARERTSDYVKIRLLNQIAADRAQIEEVFDARLRSAGLRHASYLRDDFLDALRAPVSQAGGD